MISGEGFPNSKASDQNDANLSAQEQTSFEDDESQSEELPTPEQKTEALTFERVSELSTEEYIELWRHLNPFYVSHATRQGVRDHSGMVYHSAGLGAFSNGMKAMLRDGKSLRTKAGANFGLMPGFTEEDVEAAIDAMISQEPEFYEGLTPEEILWYLPTNATIASAEPWSDEMAVHMGQLTVLSELYGAETGNEVFCIFPTDVIASQCRFGGHMLELTTARTTTDRQWNDIFIWPKDGAIPLDAGFVFLPKSQRVDRKTGSKYSLREQVTETGETVLVPEVDEERISRFKAWLESLTEESPEVIAIRQGQGTSLMKQKLREIGIPEHCINSIADYGSQYTILRFIQRRDLGNIPQEQSEHMTPEERTDYSIRKYLRELNADLKEAEDTVSAQEYWEQYFTEHPEQRPKHIVYYDGDPSSAVEEFLVQNGIAERKSPNPSHIGVEPDPQITGPGDSSERDGKMLGFDSHFVLNPREDDEMASEHRRFNELALKILLARQKSSS